MSLRPCSDLVRPLLKHPCFISARIKNALHNLSLPLKPPASPQCFTIPPQNFKIRAVGATTIIHYSLFIFHHSSFIIFADNPAIPTITATPHYPSPRTAPISNSRHRRNHNYSLFIFHYSSFIIFAANPAIPTITATLHYPSPRTIKNRNPRRR